MATRKDAVLLDGLLKSKLVAWTLTQVPPETGGTQTTKCGRDKGMVRMTQREGDCPFPTIFPLFYVLNSSFLLRGQVEYFTHCAHGVNCFSCDILLPHPIVYCTKGAKRPTLSFTNKSENSEDMQCWYKCFDLWCSCNSIFSSQLMNQQTYGCQIL